MVYQSPPEKLTDHREGNNGASVVVPSPRAWLLRAHSLYKVGGLRVSVHSPIYRNGEQVQYVMHYGEAPPNFNPSFDQYSANFVGSLYDVASASTSFYPDYVSFRTSCAGGRSSFFREIYGYCTSIVRVCHKFNLYLLILWYHTYFK